MQRIDQRDLKKGMLVVDVDCTEIGALFEVVRECTETRSLGLRLLSHDNLYTLGSSVDGLNNFGRGLLYGETDWYIPTAKEIELIKNRDK